MGFTFRETIILKKLRSFKLAQTSTAAGDAPVFFTEVLKTLSAFWQVPASSHCYPVLAPCSACSVDRLPVLRREVLDCGGLFLAAWFLKQTFINFTPLQCPQNDELPVVGWDAMTITGKVKYSEGVKKIRVSVECEVGILAVSNSTKYKGD